MPPLPHITLISLLIPFVAFADVRINEIMSSNGSTIADEDGEYSDWIELLNDGENPVDLSGWGLSDNANQPFKWIFPEGAAIAPGELMLVWASGKDRKEFTQGTYNEQWHTRFPDAAGIWKFNEVNGNFAHDHSTHANHGSLIRAEPVNFGLTHTMQLSANLVSEVQIPNSTSLRTRNDQTISMWLKPRTIGTLQTAWHKRRGGEGIITLDPNGQLHYAWGTSGTHQGPFQSFRTTTRLVAGQWYHITIVRDITQGQLRWYINGQLDATATPSYAQSAATTLPVQIGNGINGAFNGWIGMAVLLPHALEASEIVLHHEETKGAFVKRLHTNFSLSSDGEPIVLTRPDGTQADAIPPALLRRGLSFGRTPDGDLRVFDTPSPLRPNPSEGYLGLLPPPTFSHRGGFHPTDFQLQLGETTDSQILFTVDGSEPLEQRIGGAPYPYKSAYPSPAGTPFGALLEGMMTTHAYQSPIPITDRTIEPNRLSGVATQFDNAPRAPAGNLRKATVVRARTTKEGYLPSDIITHTYWVGPDVMERFNLPVVALSTDDNNLFGYEDGIYVPGKIADAWRTKFPSSNPPLWQVEANYWQTGRDWEKPLHLEYFTPAGDRNIAMNLGVRLHGGASRAAYRKSLRLYARAEYQQGGSYIQYPLFPGRTAKGDPGRTIDSFKRVILRNGGNHSTSTFYHDALLHELISHLPLDAQAWQPVIHYINGESWGIINLRERLDTHYIESHYGIHPDDASVLDGVNASLADGATLGQDQYRGFLRAIENADPANPSTWASLNATIDIDNHALYHACQIFTGNNDWPQNNILFWKKMKPETGPDAPPTHDGRWRWMINDLDQGFRSHVVATNSLSRIANPGDSTVLSSTRLFRTLMKHPAYHRMLANHLADLMNSTFVASRVHSKVDEFNAMLAHSRAEHFQRWQSSGTINDGAGMKTFADQRTANVRQHVVNYFKLAGLANITANTPDPNLGKIQVNTLRIDPSLPGLPDPSQPYPWTGTYFRGFPVTLRAIPEPGSRFIGWLELPEEDSPEIEVNLSGDATYTALFEALPQPIAIHAWNFEANPGYLNPSLSLVAGASLNITPGPSTEVLRDTGGDFTSAHLRVNNPLGASVTYHLPTTGIEKITLNFLTRRSGQGAAQQTLSYTLNGTEWIDLDTYEILDAPPQPKFFDFSEIDGTDNNPHFSIRITFARTQAQINAAPPTGLSGNNRFDDVTLSGFPLPGTNLPPTLNPGALPSGTPILVASQQPLTLDLTTVFSDPNGDELTFSASSSLPGIATAQSVDGELTVTGIAPGEALLTLEADDGVNPPVSTSFMVLVHPAAHPLESGSFTFNAWAATSPAMTYPANMIFLQSEQNDPTLATELNRAYQIPLADAAVPQDADFPYAPTSRTRINGLGENGIAFINTGRGRDVGSAIAAIDTTGIDSATISFTAGTLTVNNRIYAIRLQYRVGSSGPFLDMLDENGNPIEYIRAAAGNVVEFGPIPLPAEALGNNYVQLQWKYHYISGTGSRAQLRLDNILVSAGPTDSGFDQWRTDAFSEAELLDPLISGPNADPTNSGIVNLMRYALGLGRNDPPQHALPTFTSNTGFRFPFDPTKTDIIYRVTASHDLTDWTTVIFDSQTDDEPAPDEGFITLPINTTPPAKFFRLEVTTR